MSGALSLIWLGGGENLQGDVVQNPLSQIIKMQYFLYILQIVPSVEGIYFKDLKQTLKKEQCDVSQYCAALSVVSLT